MRASASLESRAPHPTHGLHRRQHTRSRVLVLLVPIMLATLFGAQRAASQNVTLPTQYTRPSQPFKITISPTSITPANGTFARLLSISSVTVQGPDYSEPTTVSWITSQPTGSSIGTTFTDTLPQRPDGGRLTGLCTDPGQCPNDIYRVVTRGDIAFVVTPKSLTIYRVNGTDPTRSVRLGGVPALSVSVIAQSPYVACLNSEWGLFDNFTCYAGFTDISLNGNVAYLASRLGDQGPNYPLDQGADFGVLAAVDVSNVSNPIVTQSVATGYLAAVVASDAFVYTISTDYWNVSKPYYSNTTRVIRTFNATNITQLMASFSFSVYPALYRYPYGSLSTFAVGSKQLLFHAEVGLGLRVFDVSKPRAITLVSTYNAGAYATTAVSQAIWPVFFSVTMDPVSGIYSAAVVNSSKANAVIGSCSLPLSDQPLGFVYASLTGLGYVSDAAANMMRVLDFRNLASPVLFASFPLVNAASRFTGGQYYVFGLTTVSGSRVYLQEQVYSLDSLLSGRAPNKPQVFLLSITLKDVIDRSTVRAVMRLVVDSAPIVATINPIPSISFLPSQTITIPLDATKMFSDTDNELLALSLWSPDSAVLPYWASLNPQPGLISSYPSTPTATTLHSFVVSGSLLIEATSAGVVVIDVSDVTNPSTLSTLVPTADVTALALFQDLLIFAISSSGVYTYNISTPSSPRSVGFVDSVHVRSTWGCNLFPDYIEMVGFTGFVWSGNCLAIVSFRNPAVPKPMSIITILQSYSYALMAVFESTVVLWDHNPASIYVYDVSNSSAPIQVGFFSRPYSSYGCGYASRSGNTIYLSYATELILIDITNPLAPLFSIARGFCLPLSASLGPIGFAGPTSDANELTFNLTMSDYRTPTSLSLPGALNANPPSSTVISGTTVFAQLDFAVAMLDYSTWAITFTPAGLQTDPGNYQFVVTATDKAGLSASTPFSVQIQGPPVLQPNVLSSKALLATAGKFFSFFPPQGVFVDPNNDILTYSAYWMVNNTVAPFLPGWLAFNGNSATLGGTPSLTDVGTMLLRIDASDRITPPTSMFVTVQVIAPPLAFSIPPQHAQINQSFSYVIPNGTFVADRNVSASLVLSASLQSGGPIPPWLSFVHGPNPACDCSQVPSGACWCLFGTPLQHDASTVSISITAVDAAGNSAASSFSLRANRAPFVATTPSASVADVGVFYSFSLPPNLFFDPDGDALSYTAALLPVWLTFDPIHLRFTGTASPADHGTTSVSVTADDGFGGTATLVLPITVVNPPVAVTVPVAFSYFAGTTFNISIPSFSREAADSCTYVVTQPNSNPLPPWLTFNSTTRALTGAPQLDVGGSFTIIVSATDPFGTTTSSSFSVHIDRVPVLVSQAPASQAVAYIGAPFTYSLPAGTFFDADGDALSYGAPLLPPWLTFDASHARLTGTPSEQHHGTSFVLISVADSFGGSASVNVTIPVVYPPVASNIQVASSYFAGSAFTIPIPSMTLEPSDWCTYVVTQPNSFPLPPWLTFNATARSLTGTPQRTTGGSFEIIVSATDPFGTTASSSFSIHIDRAPVVASQPQILVAYVSEPFSYSLPASTFADEDGDTLSYSAPSLPSWLTFDASHVRVTGTPSAQHRGTSLVSITAADAFGGSASLALPITVVYPPAAPSIHVASSYFAGNNFNISIPSFTLEPMDTCTYVVTQLNGNPLPTWLTFNVTARTLFGAPPVDVGGSFTVIVSATDPFNRQTSTSFSLHIDRAPAVMSQPQAFTAYVGEPFFYLLPSSAIVDPDGDTLSYNALTLPTWLTFDQPHARLTGTATSQNAGDSIVVIAASDPFGAVATVSLNVSVVLPPVAPTIQPAASYVSGSLLAIQIPSFSQSVPDTFTYTAALANGSPLPSWLSFDGQARILTGHPQSGNGGTISVVVSATDPFGKTVSASFSLHVISAPTVSGLISPVSVNAGESLNLVFPETLFTSSDAGTVTYAATLASGAALPGWLQFNSVDRRFSGTPQVADSGSYEVLIIATADGVAGLKASTQFTITVSVDLLTQIKSYATTASYAYASLGIGGLVVLIILRFRRRRRLTAVRNAVEKIHRDLSRLCTTKTGTTSQLGSTAVLRAAFHQLSVEAQVNGNAAKIVEHMSKFVSLARRFYSSAANRRNCPLITLGNFWPVLTSMIQNTRQQHDHESNVIWSRCVNAMVQLIYLVEMSQDRPVSRSDWETVQVALNAARTQIRGSTVDIVETRCNIAVAIEGLGNISYTPPSWRAYLVELLTAVTAPWKGFSLIYLSVTREWASDWYSHLVFKREVVASIRSIPQASHGEVFEIVASRAKSDWQYVYFTVRALQDLQTALMESAPEWKPCTKELERYSHYGCCAVRLLCKRNHWIRQAARAQFGGEPELDRESGSHASRDSGGHELMPLRNDRGFKRNPHLSDPTIVPSSESLPSISGGDRDENPAESGADAQSASRGSISISIETSTAQLLPTVASPVHSSQTQTPGAAVLMPRSARADP